MPTLASMEYIMSQFISVNEHNTFNLCARGWLLEIWTASVKFNFVTRPIILHMHIFLSFYSPSKRLLSTEHQSKNLFQQIMHYVEYSTLTMFASDNVHILTKPGMTDSFQCLKSSQYLDGVWRERQTICTTLVVCVSWSIESGYAKTSASKWLHFADKSMPTMQYR